ncbi:hypothetical protein GN958_ATG04181 [Phytophthora infestans]|uniref:Secreted RxLR effector peptide protein n=1 Tax=Phytophthora infestans TaxID=4787 RepID=A0A8S9V7X1_PHYIN|nr:hypothetical protein GN958_ATG04181 [Phytophthora infestans]
MSARRWMVIVMTLLALWGFDVVISKMTSNFQQEYRDAKARQAADRHTTEVMRQRILAESAAKFEQRQREFGNYDVNYSWNQRYRNSASRYNNRNYQNSANRGNNRNNQYSANSRNNNRNYQNSANRNNEYRNNEYRSNENRNNENRNNEYRNNEYSTHRHNNQNYQ